MITVREGHPEDALEVAAVHIRSWQVAYRDLFPREFLEGLRVEERAARYTFGVDDREQPHTLLAVDGHAICGFASTGQSRDRDAPHAGELHALYVDPPYWGTGVGRRLLRDACARLRSLGYEEAVLWVLVGNQRAERFYRADGWRHDGSRRLEDPWGITAEVMRYRRPLV